MSEIATPKPRPIELLAPARDAATGREAILHGADAVYIGGPAFGARAAAAVAVADIAELCQFAHLYGARVYVALNTILYDNELKEAEQLVWQLYEAGADALIVQDMALLGMKLPPIALHASTQTDNRTPQKAQELQAMGFSQIVLARELSLTEINAISKVVSVPLEAFVHGALCVSYSGRCYASQHCFKRSANRGECAQFCRLAFDLIDGRGQAVRTNKHLLSLRDMNRSASLEAMMDAGISSFKIEGRLKDTAYVKNTVAYYRQRIDEIISQRGKDYRRSSFGKSDVGFTPDVERSFNRGFTAYFLHNPERPMASHDTPASLGKRIGTVKACNPRAVQLKLLPNIALTAGDGLCYHDAEGGLTGFRVNRAEGATVFPHQPQRIKPGTPIFRNHDAAFERTLSHPTATRTLALHIQLSETPTGFCLQAKDESDAEISLVFEHAHETAKTPQTEQICRQLARLGGTAWRAEEIDVNTNCFIPASVLAAWKRSMVEKLTKAHQTRYQRPERLKPATKRPQMPQQIDYTYNVANAEARNFYETRGTKTIAPAYELQQVPKATLMTCRYCLRRELGACLREKEALQLTPPLALCMADGRTFPLIFNCKKCEMRVMADEKG
ncbi:MAG: U32 family peptidase [Bacteroidaceae bacterium]|nr:U32 family peptidase [Bacteroidaceae bacterium]